MTTHAAKPISISDEERRLLGKWAADCAARVLPLFEARAPADSRPRAAIEAIRLYAEGGKRTAQLRSAAWAALSAARGVGDPVAMAAARAAGYAAATAYIHALATPHQVTHILSPAVQEAYALELAAGGNLNAGDEALQEAIAGAPSAVRDIVGRLPARRAGRSRLDTLLYRLDSALRQ